MINIRAERLEHAKPFDKEQYRKGHSKLYIETYGCQMNFSDSEIIASLMQDDGFEIC
ncbi:MAG: hypothetical protein P1P88_12815, partial [Bacteroidales bacterium]|nr:hypothetical protein [Bacteroidales bacterium]